MRKHSPITGSLGSYVQLLPSVEARLWMLVLQALSVDIKLIMLCSNSSVDCAPLFILLSSKFRINNLV